MPSVVFFHSMHQRMMGSYIRSSPLFIGFLLSSLNFPFMKKEISTGARVSTRIASTISIKVLVYASG